MHAPSQAEGNLGNAEWIDKPIDTLTTVIQMGATIYDLEEAELCLAPQFGSAKSPVNFAGMVAADVRRGDMPLSHWPPSESEFLLEARHPEEPTVEQAPGAVNIPPDELRARLDELPRDRELHVIWRSGQRAYYATCILMQNGFDARCLSGGMLSHTILAAEGEGARQGSEVHVSERDHQPGRRDKLREIAQEKEEGQRAR